MVVGLTTIASHIFNQFPPLHHWSLDSFDKTRPSLPDKIMCGAKEITHSHFYQLPGHKFVDPAFDNQYFLCCTNLICLRKCIMNINLPLC